MRGEGGVELGVSEDVSEGGGVVGRGSGQGGGVMGRSRGRGGRGGAGQGLPRAGVVGRPLGARLAELVGHLVLLHVALGDTV